MDGDTGMSDYLKRFNLEVEEEWETWMEQIPSFKVPEGFQIKITPPFAGAIVRFRLKYKNKEVSVYLDCHERLGCFGSPYWEAYPINGDTYRARIDELDNLIEIIEKELRNEVD